MSPTTGPAPGAGPAGPNAAPALRRVVEQARFETAAVLRNGEQLLLLLVLPALVLVVLTRSDLVTLGTDPGSRVSVAAPGVLALAVLSTAFTSQAITTAFDRRSGVLRLLATTPLGRGGLLGGKALTVLAVELVQLVVLGGIALALGWDPAPAALGAALLATVLATVALTALALLMAGTMRPEAVLAASNLVWVLLLLAGGVVVPPARLPEALATLAPWLPSGALAEILRATLSSIPPTGPSVGTLLLVLAAWAAVLGLAARATFRWS